MSKAIMISIKPKYVAKILNGEKTIEIRKTMPKCDLPIDVYIYCTKDKPYLANGYELFTNKYSCLTSDEDIYKEHKLNGKVVAKFTLNKVEEISYNYRGDYTSVYTDTLDTEDLEKQACLTRYEFADYLDTYYGYAIHISQLEIFDKPKELSEFKTRHYPQFAGMVKNKTHYELKPLTKAPQSFMYVEV